MTDGAGDAGGPDADPGHGSGSAGDPPEPRLVVGEVEEPGADLRGSGGPGGTGRSSFRMQARTWSWGDEEVRRGVPWIGVFLVVFGAILLIGQAVPDAHVLGSALTTALGVALLVSWATGRRWGLYPGLLITAYSLPGLLVDLGLIPAGSGYGTFLFGLGLLIVAAMRWRARRTWGWQLIVGGILAIAGAWDLAGRRYLDLPGLGQLLAPILLVLLGALILTRSRRR